MKKFFIQTFGCQMNVYDSWRIAAMLEHRGMQRTDNIPDADIIIRTGGEKRLSNFLLWQSAYSELFFSDTLWPDFACKEFLSILSDFNNRDRRFGDVKR